MKVLVCGDRNWDNWPSIWQTLRGLGPFTVIVEGEARGADKMCKYVAEKLGYEVLPYPAEWDTYGNAAGPIRNQQMLDENPDIGLVLAFHDDLASSKGTKDMVKRARKAGIPVNVITTDDE
jgi:hypothetical protein